MGRSRDGGGKGWRREGVETEVGMGRDGGGNRCFVDIYYRVTWIRV